MSIMINISDPQKLVLYRTTFTEVTISFVNNKILFFKSDTSETFNFGGEISFILLLISLYRRWAIWIDEGIKTIGIKS